VGKPEYTPPEVQGVSLNTINQTIEHDLFGLAVLLFQMLMNGFHPFTGVVPSTMSVGRVDLYGIREGLFPYHQTSMITPPPSAPEFTILHPSTQQAFYDCFVKGYQEPTLRPTAEQWYQIIEQNIAKLRQCSTNPEHVFSNHLETCPWCKSAVPLTPNENSTSTYPPIHIQLLDILELFLKASSSHGLYDPRFKAPQPKTKTFYDLYIQTGFMLIVVLLAYGLLVFFILALLFNGLMKSLGS